jgi:hypothetical protein
MITHPESDLMLEASAGRNPAGASRVRGPDSLCWWRKVIDIDINIELYWHQCQERVVILVSIGTSPDR